MPAVTGTDFTVGTICVALIIGLPLGYALFPMQNIMEYLE